MQKAVPYKSPWMPMYSDSVFHPKNNDGSPSLSSSSPSWLQSSSSSYVKRSEVVRENAVVVFAKRGCCMGHVVKRLLLTHGVNPLVFEVEEDESVKEQLPVVFMGGKLFGGLENVMSAHINGDLEPILRQAGALWL